MDDILIIGEEINVNKIFAKLKSEFKAKDMGEIKTFLGMNISRSVNKLQINQCNQIDKIIQKYNMEDVKSR